MRRERQKRSRIIIGLVSILFLMTVGYAAFQTNLEITGTSTIDSKWDVEIISVEALSNNTSAESTKALKTGTLTAAMEADLYEVGDYMEYNVTIKNKGTLEARLNDIDKNIPSNEFIEITFKDSNGNNLIKGEKLAPNAEKVIKVKIAYVKASSETNISSEATVTFNYTQAQAADPENPGTQYLVTYDYGTNGGQSSNADDEYFDDGTEVTLNKTASKAGYTFVGWNTDSTATQALDKITISSLLLGEDGKIHVYAIYSKTITITYTKGNNVKSIGKDSDTCNVFNNDEINCEKELPTITASNSNYSVDGWYIGNTKIGKPGDKYTFTGNTTVVSKVSAPPILMTGNDFQSKISSIKSTVTSLEVVDLNDKSAPSNTPDNSTSWDVSAAGDGSVIAWVENDKLYIGGNGGVIANGDSWNLFAGFTAITSANLSKLDTSNVTRMSQMFLGCSSLTSLDISKFNTSKVTDMYGMFANCKSLTSLNLSNFDTSSVTDMRNMFADCSALADLDISKFNTSKVTSMNRMFYSCESLTSLNLSSFDTSNVTGMEFMFGWCKKLKTLNLSSFDTSNVTTMQAMFTYIIDLHNLDELLKLDLSNFDTSSVTNMRDMFGESAFEQLDVSNFDTSKVTNMSGMFADVYYEKGVLDVSNFDTSSVTDMSAMFMGYYDSMLDLSNFDTSSVTDMSYMFLDCDLTTIYASENFVTTNVTKSTDMFKGCSKVVGGNGTKYNSSKIDKEYARIDTSSTLGYFTNLISVSTTSTKNTLTVVATPNLSYFGTATKYEFSKDGGNTWVDNGTSNTYTFTGLDADTEYKVYVRVTGTTGDVKSAYKDTKTMFTDAPTFTETEFDDSKIVTINYNIDCSDSNITCSYIKNDGTEQEVTSSAPTVTFDASGTLVAKVAKGSEVVTSPTYNVVVEVVEKVPLLMDMSTIAPNQNSFFYDTTIRGTIENVKIVDLNDKSAPSGAPDSVTSWDVSEKGNKAVIAWLEPNDTDPSKNDLYIGGKGGVIANENSSNLFYNFYLTKSMDLRLLDTSNVTNMSSMFNGCSGLTILDVSSWDTLKVTNMEWMFSSCNSLVTLDVSNFDTSNVTSMLGMFSSCNSLVTLDVSNFDTGNVTSMQQMFQYCGNLEILDLSSFNTSKVTTMDSMFQQCNNLKTLNISGFDTSKVQHMNSMFARCTNLETLDLNNFDTSKVQYMTNMFMDCTNLKTLNISNFDTSKVMDMSQMFMGCEKLAVLDVASFDTTNVNSMTYIFNSCSSLTTIYASSSFVVNNYDSMMFLGDQQLVGGNGTTYQNSDSSYAQIDRAGYPGYFTDGYTPSISLTSTTNSITAVASVPFADKINKYEFSNDGSTWIDNGTNNSYKFMGLTKDTTYSIQARVTTTGGKAYVSNSKDIKTKDIDVPLFSETKTSQGKTITINYDVNCGQGGITCYYSKNGGADVEVDASTTDVEFTENGTLVAKISDGTNTVTSATYTVDVNTVYQVPTMKSWDSGAWNDFHGYKYQINVVEVVDLNQKSAPSDAPNENDSWDVSAAGDGSVIAWTEDTYDSTGRSIRTLYIGGKGGVKANSNSSYLFEGFNNLEKANLRLLDTSNTTDMRFMFSGCNMLNSLNISKFNTSNVTNMNYIFSGCSSLTELDVSNFDTSNVTNMEGMFNNCNGLTELDVSNFDTSNVTNIGFMFYSCNMIKEFDLSNFDTSKVTNTSYMFNNCNELKTIYVSRNFVVDQVTNSTDMFYNNNNLVGGNGTRFSSGFTDRNYAYIDSAEHLGYFTEKARASFNANPITATSITLVASYPTLEDITKYEFSKDNGKTWIDNGTNNTYKFIGLTKNTSYKMLVRVTTGDGNTSTSTSKTITTNDVANPIFFETKTSNGKTLTIDYDDITCGKNGVTCAYSKNGAADVEVSTNSVDVEFTANGTLVAKVYENNELLVSLSYTVDINQVIVTPLMRRWEPWETSDFHDSSYKGSITSVDIVDLNQKSVPTNAINSWDVSANNDNSVLAWLEADPTNPSNYKLYIGGAGGVKANTYSASLFYQFHNLEKADLRLLDTSDVTEMQSMFEGCQALISVNLSRFNTSNVTNMNSMFSDCQSLATLNLSSFDTSNVTSMNDMFKDCRSLRELDLSNFNTSNVTNMDNMFYGCNSLRELDLSNFNTSNVTNMSSMFFSCSNLRKLDISVFDTNRVSMMSSMFTQCGSLVTIYATDSFVVNSWDSMMFDGDNKIVGGKGTTYVGSSSDYAKVDGNNYMQGYFTDPYSPTIATNSGSSTITVVATVPRASSIAKYEFSKDTGSTWVDNGTNSTYKFTNLDKNTEYYVQVRVTTTSGATITTDTKFVRTKDLETPIFLETKTDNGKTITIDYGVDCGGDDYTCSYSKDGGSDVEVTQNEVDVDFTANGTIVAKISDGVNTVTTSTYTVNISSTTVKPTLRSWTSGETNDFHDWSYRNMIYSVEVVDLNQHPMPNTDVINSWGVSENYSYDVTAWIENDSTNGGYKLYIGGAGGVKANSNSSYLFDNFNSLKTANLKLLDTSDVTIMNNMFSNCNQLTNINMTRFDTSKVTNMSSMFAYDSELKELNLSNFDTSNVTNIDSMFMNCYNLSELNLSGWNTSNVINMDSMFNNCTNLTELDLSSFNTRNVSSMSSMFYNANHLRTIYATDSFKNVAYGYNMFDQNSSLVGGNGTAYSPAYTDQTYARIDTSSTPGYFTEKIMPSITANPITASSITIVATYPDSSKVTKYEFSNNNGKTWVDNGTNSTYKFTGLKKNTKYKILVRVTTKDGTKVNSIPTTVSTVNVSAPTIKKAQTDTGKDVTITYPDGCGTEYKCYYSKDDGADVEVTTKTKVVSFTQDGTLVAKVYEGTELVASSSYTIKAFSTGFDGTYYSIEAVRVNQTIPDGEADVWVEIWIDTYNNNDQLYGYFDTEAECQAHINETGASSNTCQARTVDFSEKFVENYSDLHKETFLKHTFVDSVITKSEVCLINDGSLTCLDPDDVSGAYSIASSIVEQNNGTCWSGDYPSCSYMITEGNVNSTYTYNFTPNPTHTIDMLVSYNYIHNDSSTMKWNNGNCYVYNDKSTGCYFNSGG